MDRIKVLLAYSSLRSESLTSLIEGQADMKVVGELSDPVGILLAADQTQADVVVMLGQNLEQEPGICSHLMSEYPRLLILTVSPDYKKALLYRQTKVKEWISPLSNEIILNTIRQCI